MPSWCVMNQEYIYEEDYIPCIGQFMPLSFLRYTKPPTWTISVKKYSGGTPPSRQIRYSSTGWRSKTQRYWRHCRQRWGRILALTAFDCFYEKGGGKAIKKMFAFSPSSSKTFWEDLEDHVKQKYNVGCGRRSYVTGRDGEMHSSWNWLHWSMGISATYFLDPLKWSTRPLKFS